MRRRFFIFAAFLATVAAFSQDVTDDAQRFNLLHGIKAARPPVLKDGCVVWTSDGAARFVGIAFEHENFGIVHPFERLNFCDDDGNLENSLLFFAYRVPTGRKELNYRLVVDGLWTTDPQNSAVKYDCELGISMSSLQVEPAEVRKTEQLPDGRVRFVYVAPQGLRLPVSLAGSFNNWDAEMYYLEDEGDGVFSTTISVPAGVQHYVFMVGLRRELDSGNPNRDYSSDGKCASTLVVK